MIRVLWLVPEGQSWLGGVNYYRNLLQALHSLPDRQLEPVIAGNPANLPSPLNSCATITQSVCASKFSWEGFWFRAKRKFLNYEASLEDFMRQSNVSVLTHSLSKALRSNTHTELCWIPDFQHIHLPNFFSKQECQIRSNNYASIAEKADGVILSSETARKDFTALFPQYAHKAHVLTFVAPPPDMPSAPQPIEVMERYGISEPYIHIPNQLWIHKNHKVAIEALGIIKRETGICPLIICTGHTEDYRHPEFFSQIQNLVKNEGVEDRFLFLGVVPYIDLYVLMREARCMLNPSLFEGWSTTVEEAKSMGKKLILSDIPVHLEQNPKRGVFFSASDPHNLAEKIMHVMASYNSEEEVCAAQEAAMLLPERMADYGRRYQQIVINALHQH